MYKPYRVSSFLVLSLLIAGSGCSDSKTDGGPNCPASDPTCLPDGSINVDSSGTVDVGPAQGDTNTDEDGQVAGVDTPGADDGGNDKDGTLPEDGACAPDCSDKVCGDDGCGGLCGECPAAQYCVDGGCTADCPANCIDKTCGPDGCGGVCGVCQEGEACEAGACVPPPAQPAP